MLFHTSCEFFSIFVQKEEEILFTRCMNINELKLWTVWLKYNFIYLKNFFVVKLQLWRENWFLIYLWLLLYYKNVQDTIKVILCKKRKLLVKKFKAERRKDRILFLLLNRTPVDLSLNWLPKEKEQINYFSKRRKKVYNILNKIYFILDVYKTAGFLSFENNRLMNWPKASFFQEFTWTG